MNKLDILNQISQNDEELKVARSLLADIKQKMLDAETILIGLKIKQEQLKQNLDKCNNEINDHQTDDKETIRFALKVKELWEKIT